MHVYQSTCVCITCTIVQLCMFISRLVPVLHVHCATMHVYQSVCACIRCTLCNYACLSVDLCLDYMYIVQLCMFISRFVPALDVHCATMHVYQSAVPGLHVHCATIHVYQSVCACIRCTLCNYACLSVDLCLCYMYICDMMVTVTGVCKLTRTRLHSISYYR